MPSKIQGTKEEPCLSFLWSIVTQGTALPIIVFFTFPPNSDFCRTFQTSSFTLVEVSGQHHVITNAFVFF